MTVAAVSSVDEREKSIVRKFVKTFDGNARKRRCARLWQYTAFPIVSYNILGTDERNNSDTTIDTSTGWTECGNRVAPPSHARAHDEWRRLAGVRGAGRTRAAGRRRVRRINRTTRAAAAEEARRGFSRNSFPPICHTAAVSPAAPSGGPAVAG